MWHCILCETKANWSKRNSPSLETNVDVSSGWLLQQFVAYYRACIGSYLSYCPIWWPLYRFDNVHVCCCTLLFDVLFVKVQHSLPKTIIGGILRLPGEWSAARSWVHPCPSVDRIMGDPYNVYISQSDYIWRCCSWSLLLVYFARLLYCLDICRIALGSGLSDRKSWLMFSTGSTLDDTC